MALDVGDPLQYSSLHTVRAGTCGTGRRGGEREEGDDYWTDEGDDDDDDDNLLGC